MSPSLLLVVCLGCQGIRRPATATAPPQAHGRDLHSGSAARASLSAPAPSPERRKARCRAGKSVAASASSILQRVPTTARAPLARNGRTRPPRPSPLPPVALWQDERTTRGWAASSGSSRQSRLREIVSRGKASQVPLLVELAAAWVARWITAARGAQRQKVCQSFPPQSAFATP